MLFRELQRRKAAGEDVEASELEKVFEYQGIDTCAATGLCADRCPVGINTGELVKKLRKPKYKKFRPIAKWTADHFSATTTIARFGLKSGDVASNILGRERVAKLADGMRKVTKQATPAWLPETPGGAKFDVSEVHKGASNSDKKVVYLPSCASRNMNTQPNAFDQRSLGEVTMSLIEKAGYSLIAPKSLSDQCCGMPYDSKGMTDIATQKSEQLEQALWEASEQGKYPVLMDTSPCAKRSIEQFTKPLTIVEPVKFVSDYLADELELNPVEETVMLHVTCSSRRMGLESTMLQLAKACAAKVVLPEHIQCCGWAGDKGFTTPELNEAAVAPLKDQVPADCTRGFSNSITCEIGLSHHSGVPYQSILYLVDQVSSPIKR